MSYLDHFKFQRQPFSEHASREALWNDTRMEEGLSRLSYLLDNGLVGLVTGASGLGKSALVRRFIQECSPRVCEPLYCHLAHLPANGLLKFIVSQLGEVPRLGKGKLYSQILDRAKRSEGTMLLIFDEVLTGFGRTGSFLACVGAGVKPDVLCLSKGLTGGVLPLAVTCASDALFDLFWGAPEEPRAFLHGHSYTANPLACAVAAANLALFDEEPVMDQASELGARLRAAWQRLAAHPLVRRARCIGAVAACDLVDAKTGAPRPFPHRDGLAIHRAALDRGLLVRPIGNCLYLLPPLSTPGDRIDEAVETLTACLDLLE